MKPVVCVLRTDGTNCDEETAYAFMKAGGEPRLVHVNQFRSGQALLRDYSILAIPGGFSYGDDIAAGAVLAHELVSFLREQLLEFAAVGRLILGICNGFQVLVRTGLLPHGVLSVPSATLTTNDSGRFVCQWVRLNCLSDSRCVFMSGLAGHVIELPVAHGEGKFVAPRLQLQEIHERRLAPLHYLNNPNGSLQDIAGVCDPTGRVFGLMPHPERFVEKTQHPNWRRTDYGKPHGLAIFENAVRIATEL